MKKGNALGIVLILIGVLFLLMQSDFIKTAVPSLDPGVLFGVFWPVLFVIPLGIFFHLMYFFSDRKGAGILVPGGILLVAGVFMQISMLFDIWGYMWPGFLLAVAFGLFELYLFGDRSPGLLIPVGILGGLSVIFFSIFTLGALGDFTRYGLAGVFIVVGIAMFLRKDRSRS